MGLLVLLCIVEGAGAKRLRRPYNSFTRRVFDLSREGPAWLTTEDADRLSSVAHASSTGTCEESVWRRPSALMAAPRVAATYDGLRAGATGGLVTSYTRMKARDSAARSAWTELSKEPLDNASVERDDDRIVSLQASRRAGVFLHALLERVPLATFAAGSLA